MLHQKNNTWWDGTLYQKNSTHQFEVANELISKCHFEGNENVLDIGCGDGKISVLIAREKVPHGSVTGLDVSESMILIANECYHSIKNVKFICGDAQNFFCNDLYDVITSFTAMHWMPDHHSVWCNIYKLLKKKGYALVSFNPPPRQAEFALALTNTMASPEWSPYFQDYKEPAHMPEFTIDQYKDLLSNVGFHILMCDSIYTYYEYDNKKAFIDHTQAWLSNVQNLPENMREKFVKDVATKFIEYSPPLANGKIRLHFFTFKIKVERQT